jgi:uncharacterized protein GlcG (DUF336 family)
MRPETAPPAAGRAVPLHAMGIAGLLAIGALVACNGETSGVTLDPSDRGAKETMDCSQVPDADALKRWLVRAPDDGEAGGMFGGRAEWAAVVNRAGMVCAVAVANDSVGGRWPGSRNIARAKAYTANGFSTDTLAFSTARMYTLAQPGHSLYGVFQPNPFDTDCLNPTGERVCGGAIAFGGGLALYRDGRVVGGLGLSGDTPCTDHEIAKRIRHLAAMDPTKGPVVDDITYTKVDGPSIYTHPLCPNTWRNGQKIGDEPPASGY